MLGCLQIPTFEEGIAGWCFDQKSENPVSVTLFVGDIPLRTVVASLPRDDIERVHGRKNCGFHLALQQNIREVFPSSMQVSAVASNGWKLPSLKEDCRIANGCDNNDILSRDFLDKGWSVNKWGFLVQAFKNFPNRKIGVLKLYYDFSKYFSEQFGIPLFLTGGSLLGAVRDGSLLPHDDDLDASFAYYSDSPKAAARYFLFMYHEIVRVIQGSEFQIELTNFGQIVLSRGDFNFDIFPTWMTSERILYTYFGIGGYYGRESIDPIIKSVDGFDVLIPQSPERILELAYGPNWLTPDPLFQWSVAPSVDSVMEIFRNEIRRSGLI